MPRKDVYLVGGKVGVEGEGEGERGGWGWGWDWG